MIRRPRRAATTVLASFAVLATLTACTSQPGNRRVLEDQIEAFVVTSEITEEQGACMEEVLLTYSDEELEDIAAENEDEGAEPSESLEAFTANFAECMQPGAEVAPASTEPSGTTATTDASESPDTTGPSDTTEG